LSPRARHQRRHVTGAAADLREHQGAQHAGRVERRAGRRRQETHERIRGVELRGADLGLGERIHTGRQRLTAHRLLGLVDGIGDAHLHHERIAVELAQRRRLCLAAEAAEAAVRRAVGAARNAVAVAVERVRTRQNHGIGHRIEQAEAEHVGRRAVAGVGGDRRDRLTRDMQEVGERRRDLLLNDLTPDRRDPRMGPPRCRGTPWHAARYPRRLPPDRCCRRHQEPDSRGMRRSRPR